MSRCWAYQHARGYTDSSWPRPVERINPAKSLPAAKTDIDFVDSRMRVIAIIDDIKAMLGPSFPSKNGRPIPKAALVIDGEP
jgi:hypothetical protein